MEHMASKHAAILGVGPDAPTVVTEQGGKHSDSPYRMDLMPPRATLGVSAILKYGAEKYGDWNWKGTPVEVNLNHALIHIYAHLAGDKQDDHIGHATCRLLMAYELLLEENQQKGESA